MSPEIWVTIIGLVLFAAVMMWRPGLRKPIMVCGLLVVGMFLGKTPPGAMVVHGITKVWDSATASLSASPASSTGRGSAGSVRQVAYRAGFRGDKLAKATAVAMGESAGYANAVNDSPGVEYSMGLWQINMRGAVGAERRAKYHLSSNRAVFDPHVNAAIAYDMSDGGTNWAQWGAYTNGSYAQFLGSNAKIRYHKNGPSFLQAMYPVQDAPWTGLAFYTGPGPLYVPRGRATVVTPTMEV